MTVTRPGIYDLTMAEYHGQDFGALRFREALGQGGPGQGCGEGGKQQASLHDYGFRRCIGT